ncbi:MAG: hypothetical protein AAF493_09240 [Pseudomonadota bacterium]
MSITQSAPVGTSSRRTLVIWFVVVNVMVWVLAASGALRIGALSAAPYIVALTVICTMPLLITSSIRGRYALLFAYLGFYFLTFGLGDLANLAVGTEYHRVTRALMSGGEVAVLVGAVSFFIGYLLLVQAVPRRTEGMFKRDWSPKAIIIAGLIFWAYGFYLNAVFRFGVGDHLAGVEHSGSLAGVTSLLRLLQPIGSLLLIYFYLTTRNKFALALLLFTMLCDFGLGFLGDSKETALRAPALFVLSLIFLRGRLPIYHILALIVAAAICFALFSAYRTSLRHSQDTRVESAENIASKIQDIIGSGEPFGEQFNAGLEYLANRSTLKPNVEMIVRRTGKDVPFQEGYTLSVLLFALVPRAIYPDKPDTSSGRLFNAEFGVSASKLTYISQGQNGELYWNFGWPGLIFGMLAIGAILGFVNGLIDLDRRATLPRFLFLAMTAYLLCIRMETNLGIGMTLWIRVALLLMLLHFIFPKIRITRVVRRRRTSNFSAADTSPPPRRRAA